MTHRKAAWIPLACVAAAGLLVSGGLTGCGGEEEAVVKAPPAPPPPPPPPPQATSIEDLMAELDIDERVRVRTAPDSEADRRAVLLFFDAFARGDVARLKEMLPMEEEQELEEMIASGEFQQGVENIEEIWVEAGSSPTGQLAVMGIFTVGFDYQPSMWYLMTDMQGAQFDAAPTPPDVLNRISGNDRILAWHQLIEEEREKAQEADFELELPQQVLEGATGGGEGPGQQPASPGGPGPGPGGPSPGPGGPGPGGPGPGAPI